MRIWYLAFLAGAIGGGVGIAAAIAQVGIRADVVSFSANSAGLRAAASRANAGSFKAGSPKIVVDEPVYDFGVMDSEEDKEHDFVIRNVGDVPLEIENGGTSCKCAISHFQSKVLAPGKSTQVTLAWHAQGYYGPYEQMATIKTNDPTQPKVELTVKGRITAKLRVSPPEVAFSGVSALRGGQGAVQIYAYASDHLKLTDVGMQDPSTAEFFEITPKRLSAEQLSQEQDARSGYEIGIHIKPGLPLGRFQQTILIHTDLPKFALIEVPIKGTVEGDISVVGRDWDPNKQTLRLGVLSPGEGADRTLLLVVRGRYRQAIDFEIAEVFPPNLLTVELGEPLRGGATVRVPLKIHIPKQSGPANYLGTKQSPSGRILLNTNHPQTPQITIPISFAVEGG